MDMRKNDTIAYMVRRTKDNLYTVCWQSAKSYNWVPCAWYNDEIKANDMCLSLARLEKVTAYNLGGYEIK